MDKRGIIQLFPLLEKDEVFASSSMSPATPDYNCIAWAYKMFDDRWMQPPSGNPLSLDAICWWPDDISADPASPEGLKEVFEKAGFVECQSWEHEKGFVKVALYQKDDKWTHAARECRTKQSWMSKLGRVNDIYHKNPFTIEGSAYGHVYCFMKLPDK